MRRIESKPAVLLYNARTRCFVKICPHCDTAYHVRKWFLAEQNEYGSFMFATWCVWCGVALRVGDEERIDSLVKMAGLDGVAAYVPRTSR